MAELRVTAGRESGIRGPPLQSTASMICLNDGLFGGAGKEGRRKGWRGAARRVARISFNKWLSNGRNWRYGRQNQRPKLLGWGKVGVGVGVRVRARARARAYGNKCRAITVNPGNVGQFTVIVTVITSIIIGRRRSDRYRLWLGLVTTPRARPPRKPFPTCGLFFSCLRFCILERRKRRRRSLRLGKNCRRVRSAFRMGSGACD